MRHAPHHPAASEGVASNGEEMHFALPREALPQPRRVRSTLAAVALAWVAWCAAAAIIAFLAGAFTWLAVETMADPRGLR